MYAIEWKVYSLRGNMALSEATLVKLDVNEGIVTQATSGTDEVFWVTTINSSAWQSVSVQEDGIAKVKLGGTVAVWDKLTATAGWVAIKAVSWNSSFGIALQAGATNNIIPVLLRRTTA